MDKPRNVVIAVNMLWATIALGLVNTLVTGLPKASAAAGPIFAAIVLTGVFGTIALIIFKIAAGRNWARITYAVLFVLGLPPLFAILPKIVDSPVRGIVLLIQTLLQAYAIFLIFSKPGNSWFQKAKADTYTAET